MKRKKGLIKKSSLYLSDTEQLEAQCGKARAGTLTLPHGTFNTPAFMPVGTQVRAKEEIWGKGLSLASFERKSVFNRIK